MTFIDFAICITAVFSALRISGVRHKVLEVSGHLWIGVLIGKLTESGDPNLYAILIVASLIEVLVYSWRFLQ